MILKRTNSLDKDFIFLVNQLDTYLNKDRLSAFPEYNNIETIKYALVIYSYENQPIGCGAIRQHSNDTMEVKRMFVIDTERQKGIASKILNELETWTLELGMTKTILETGKDMLDAVTFYLRNEYVVIDNYEPYTTNEQSICFEKQLLV